MTPTREQVIEWAKEAGLPDAISAHPAVKQAFALAYSAGRAQGLREAREMCNTFYNHEAKDCADAIEQLEGK